jgi:hypothetical protein
MAGIFHDTFFALLVRASLGPTYFPHTDERNPPSIYQRTIRRKKSSETTLGPAVEDHDDPMVGRGLGYGAYDEQGAHPTDSRALQSSLTIVALTESPKPAKEEGSDSLLVTWYGPDDPEVRQDCHASRTSR